MTDDQRNSRLAFESWMENAKPVDFDTVLRDAYQAGWDGRNADLGIDAPPLRGVDADPQVTYSAWG